ncbi:Eco57I restriction-modification methylase domain-containing protein [Spiroplasma alleghenense]|uniref:Type II methyltransferase M.TaqI-like domain-containing protein n=1 Tax=Spiroplasma alleghenense TaxID=216931 RepID=A0A345Z4T4_9MOLU|nr:hypothetical protein [Spiroplasma alleghenense]AXK51613.1 hypothetical protein SALLE_v1c09430 [Spiroplasma alleghenense]
MKKNELGQYFTVKNSWITRPVLSFINKNILSRNLILDPFAGNGDLFDAINSKIPNKEFEYKGFDIDKELSWEINDSLKQIPLNSPDKTFIITNPPYLAKNSCKRNGFNDTYKKYFNNSMHVDLYLIALETMIDLKIPGVAIVPETFINSKFSKEFISKIVIIEPNPFADTEVPICIVCFDGSKKQDCVIYKNNDKIGKLSKLLEMNPLAKNINLFDLRFNDIKGRIAIKGVDSTNPNEKIKFLNKSDLNYNLSNIKVSSRAITIINSKKLSNLDDKSIEKMIDCSNSLLNNYREQTRDVLLTPFKGNDKNNSRRRRLDFKIARAIIEIAYQKVIIGDINGTELQLHS